jgi:hypothetical protein
VTAGGKPLHGVATSWFGLDGGIQRNRAGLSLGVASVKLTLVGLDYSPYQPNLTSLAPYWCRRRGKAGYPRSGQEDAANPSGRSEASEVDAAGTATRLREAAISTARRALPGSRVLRCLVRSGEDDSVCRFEAVWRWGRRYGWEAE